MTYSWYFFASYQENKTQTVILECLMCLDLNFFKSYDINANIIKMFDNVPNHNELFSLLELWNELMNLFVIQSRQKIE